MSKQFDIYEAITDRMVSMMEGGIIPWKMPWLQVSDGAVKHRNGHPYSLLNQFLLGEPGEYLSFKEATEAGGHVKKGAKSRIVVFWKWVVTEAKNEDGSILFDDQGRACITQFPYLRYSNVFHIRDCEGIEPKWDKKENLNDIPTDEKAEAVLTDYFTREGVKFENLKQIRSYYSPIQDRIVLPLREQFLTMPEYYSTAFHEAVHSTGHPKRLSRFSGTAFADDYAGKEYSKEELVAEIGASALMNQVGIETEESFRNNTAYVQGWLKALKDDKHLIVSAAGKADKAVRLILDVQPVQEAEA